MKFKLFLSLCLFVAGLEACFAQTIIRVSYFNSAGHNVKTRDSADYVRTIYEMDKATSLYDFKDEYANGKLKRVGKTRTLSNISPEGLLTYYYPTGVKKSAVNFENGKAVGDDYEYYTNGQLRKHVQYRTRPANLGAGIFFLPYIVLEANDSLGKAEVVNGAGYYVDSTYWVTSKIRTEGYLKDGLRGGQWKGMKQEKDGDIYFTETYKNGQLISGFSVDRNNKKYSYTNGQQEAIPHFPFGEQAFVNFLKTHVVYPEIARKHNIAGRVYVSFVVNKDGSLSDVKAIRAPSIELAAEAVRAMQDSPNWEPGKMFGQPVSFPFTVPINFTLGQGQ